MFSAANMQKARVEYSAPWSVDIFLIINQINSLYTFRTCTHYLYNKLFINITVKNVASGSKKRKLCNKAGDSIHFFLISCFE
jgi:hypothetical protein